MNNQSKFAYSSKKSYSQESFEGDKLEIRATEARHFGTPKMTLTSLSLSEKQAHESQLDSKLLKLKGHV